jgi:hypothetical protein
MEWNDVEENSDKLLNLLDLRGSGFENQLGQVRIGLRRIKGMV